MDVTIEPFRGPGWAVRDVTCFPCGEAIKWCESLMRLDCSGLVLAFSTGLCHRWSCLGQDGLENCTGLEPSSGGCCSALKVARVGTTQAAGLGGAAGAEQIVPLPWPS